MHTLLLYAEKIPLLGHLWIWAAGANRVVETAAVLAACTALLLCVLWTNNDDGYAYFKEPTLGIPGDRIRAVLTMPLVLPLTFHAAPIIWAGILLYWLLRASVALGRMAVRE